MDGINLGQSKEGLGPSLLDSIYLLEFSEIEDDKESLVTISVNDVKEFSLAGRLINFDTLESLFQEEEVIPGDEDDIFLLPKFNLSLNIDYQDKNFSQVLIYHDSIKDFMESDLSDPDADEQDLSHPLYIPTILEFKPFQGLGNFAFGISAEDFARCFNIRLKEKPEIGVFYDNGEFYFEFEQGKLSKIILNQLIEMYDIIFEGNNINSNEGLQALINSQNHIEKNLRYEFPQLGLIIWKDLSKLCFFESL